MSLKRTGQDKVRDNFNVSKVRAEIDKTVHDAVYGEIIRPNFIADRTGFPLIEVHKELGLHERRNIVTSMLELYCPYCNKNSGTFASAFWDIPKKFKCPHCGKTCDDAGKISDNALIVYRKETW